MNTWKSFLALTVAGMIVTGPVWAQSQKEEGKNLQAPANPATKSEDTSKSSKSEDTSAPSGTSAAPSASPSTDTKSGADTTKSDTMKSDSMKSDTKSDSMKSDTMKSDRGAGKSARAGNRDQVRQMQQALKDKGHDPGDIDGVMGAKTKAALKDFQKAEGLKETGMLDKDTKSKLGMEGTKSSSTGTSGSPSASPATAPSTGGSTGGGTSSGAGGSTDQDKTPKTK